MEEGELEGERNIFWHYKDMELLVKDSCGVWSGRITSFVCCFTFIELEAVLSVIALIA